MHPKYTAIRIQTKPDRNGNSRRGWVIMNQYGDSCSFVDEQAAGVKVIIKSPFAHMLWIANSEPIPVSPLYFRQMKRLEGNSPD